jgi:thymidylate synthase (FAD)
MKIIKQNWMFEDPIQGEDILNKIERAGRTCYLSSGESNPATFVKNLITSGHHSVLEHVNISVRIITDRGVTHEIVRHRLASYSQESTRYCNYSNRKFGSEITVILPVWLYEEYDRLKSSDIEMPVDPAYVSWNMAMLQAENYYFELLKNEWKPQQARAVLPNSLKTEIVMTCNIREWRHFFSLRCSKAAHPQMRELALSMLAGFSHSIPVLFDDITEKFLKEEDNET